MEAMVASDSEDYEESEEGDEDEDEDEDEDIDDIIEFDEPRFRNLIQEMMQEMVGLPPKPIVEDVASKAIDLPSEGRVQKLDDINETEMQNLEKAMEAELFQSGVLNLGSAPTDPESTPKSSKGKSVQEEQIEAGEPGEDEEVDIDFNLAQNLLESLKGQVGAAGPASNLMGLLGVKMPRDEPD